MEPSHRQIQERTDPLPTPKSRGFTPFKPNTVVEWELDNRAGCAVVMKSTYNGLHATDLDPNTGDPRHIHIPWTAVIEEVPRRRYLTGLVMHLFAEHWNEKIITQHGERFIREYIMHPERTISTRRADLIELASRLSNECGKLSIEQLLQDDDALMAVANSRLHLDTIGRHLQSPKQITQFILWLSKSESRIALATLPRVTMRTKLFEIAASAAVDAVAEAAYKRLEHVTPSEKAELIARSPSHELASKILTEFTSEADVVRLCCTPTKQYTPSDEQFLYRVSQQILSGPKERQLSLRAYRTILGTSPHGSLCGRCAWKLRHDNSREEIEAILRQNPNLSDTDKQYQMKQLAHDYKS